MFPIIEVPVGSADLLEQLGTKEKFWYADAQLGRSLFKIGRANTGENWAEKLACELAAALGIPHAYYELARCGDQTGVVCPNFVPKGGRLIHGNEIFSKSRQYAEFADAKNYRSRAHTVTLFAAFFKRATEDGLVVPPKDFEPFDGVSTAADVVVGYLMLDTWIGNQDRHDQNWGVVLDPLASASLYLAPSFDHGSSFARNLTEAKCDNMLTTKDMGCHISTFVGKARSGLYPHSGAGGVKSLLTIEAFSFLCKLWPHAARAWLNRLGAVGAAQVQDIVATFPDEILSPVRRKFLVEFLMLNQERLLALEPGKQ
ncbi:phosphatidylinositol kinase [Burkholderia sp. BDU5]|uniref:phosphatidylinositol kinase n=2 Tax=Burkholderia TaxID=32008 RepID=UPI0012E3C6C4|nr:phosphatidylinositol kinase [Burkholderia sp. BDU5]